MPSLGESPINRYWSCHALLKLEAGGHKMWAISGMSMVQELAIILFQAIFRTRRKIRSSAVILTLILRSEGGCQLSRLDFSRQ
ncbi:hypothetical protein BDW75DRAFT_218614 [Aspergillus navahoensis]